MDTKAKLAFKEQKFQLALELYTELIKECKDSETLARYYTNKSLAYYKLEKFNEALVEINESLKLNPNLDTSYCRKSMILEKQKNFYQALQVILDLQ